MTVGEYVGTPQGLESVVQPYNRFLVAPLAVGGEVIGVVAMGRIKDESFDWSEYDPDDTVRFFALRVADAKLVKKTPQQILTDGADFTYFRQLRTELRA